MRKAKYRQLGWLGVAIIVAGQMICQTAGENAFPLTQESLDRLYVWSKAGMCVSFIGAGFGLWALIQSHRKPDGLNPDDPPDLL